MVDVEVNPLKPAKLFEALKADPTLRTHFPHPERPNVAKALARIPAEYSDEQFCALCRALVDTSLHRTLLESLAFVEPRRADVIVETFAAARLEPVATRFILACTELGLAADAVRAIRAAAKPQ